MIDALNARWFALMREQGIEPALPEPQAERRKVKRTRVDRLARRFAKAYEREYAGYDWREVTFGWCAVVAKSPSECAALRRAVHGELFARGVTTEPPEVG